MQRLFHFRRACWRAMRLEIPALFLLLPVGPLLAQDTPEQPDTAPWKAEMAARWSRVRAYEQQDGARQEVARVAEPIFNYVETAREKGHYGTLWVWGEQGRPVALLAQGMDIGGPARGFELAALTRGVSVVMHDGWEWNPQTSALELQEFPQAPSAAATDAARLVQIKSLARQFDVSETLGDERYQLRLLPTPVYRYRDETQGLLDGAFFLYAHGTNPEALLVIECRQHNDESAWSYGFVPLAAAAVTAQRKDRTVWSKEPTPGPKRQDPYSTWLEIGGE